MSVAGMARNGVRAARAGRESEARAFFRMVLQEDPSNETALLWLAYLAQDPRSSLAYIARALDAHPQSPRAHTALRWARRRVTSFPREEREVSPQRTMPRNQDLNQVLIGLVVTIALALGVFLVVLGTGIPGPPASLAAAEVAVLSPTSLPPTIVASPLPSATPSPTPVSPTPTPSPSPSPSPTSPPPPTATSTPTPLPPAPTATAIAWPPTPVPTQGMLSQVGLGRWIDVDLTHQVLAAYENDTLVRTVSVSTGRQYTPTPVGQFRIWVKLRYDDMTGPGYYLPDVPYVMYFYGPYSLHGTYWHDNFGQPMSHGCVNLPTSEAEWLFNWAEVGTLVNVHH